jgi:prepilin-type N-terminal cleavage/methylation domain-containing protein
MKRRATHGFTLIELLVVIAIIGLLGTLSIVAFSNSVKKARDTRRLSDMKQIMSALELYKDQYGTYPDVTDSDTGGGGYDAGCYGGPTAGDDFISQLKTSGILPRTVCDPKATTAPTTYLYYKYPAGTNGCDAARGAFYVLAVQTSDSSATPSPNSPGWACPTRDWSTAGGLGLGTTPFWVTGAFEN